MLVIADYLGVIQLCERLETHGILLSADDDVDPMSKNPDLFTLRLLGQTLNQGDLTAAYKILNATSFSLPIQPIIDDFKNSLIALNKRAIATAYTRVSVENMCQMLNMNKEKVLEFILEWGWHYDASSSLVEPKSEEAQKSYDAEASAEQVNELAKYISHFEQKSLSVKLNNKTAKPGLGESGIRGETRDSHREIHASSGI